MTAAKFKPLMFSLQFGGPGPVFISPRNTVAQLYPWTLSSPSVASYDSQGYGGGILTRLHTGIEMEEVEVKLRPTVSRPVCLGVRRPSETNDQFLFLLEILFG
jgi:hypothetical protein